MASSFVSVLAVLFCVIMQIPGTAFICSYAYVEDRPWVFAVVPFWFAVWVKLAFVAVQMH